MQISTSPGPMRSKGYQSSPHQSEYSTEGQLLAELAAASYDGASGQWRGIRKLAADGLRKIRDDASTTADEKAIARLGLDIGSDYMQNDDAARMQRSVLGVVASSVPGPIGQVLARTALGAYNSTSMTYEVARGVVKDGLEAVSSNDRTSQAEKDLANLGLTFGSGYQYNDEATRMQRKVLQAIRDGGSGPMPQTLASVTLSARNSSFRKWETVRKMEGQGLTAIRDHAEATDYDRTIADLGMNFGDDYMENDDAGKIRRVVLEEIKSPGNGNISYEIARVTRRAYGSGINYKTGRKILRESFETILGRADATESQKTMAQMGVDVGSDRMTDQEASRRRMKILNKIINLG